MSTEPNFAASPGTVSFGAALRVWARIGLLSFGGPAGQIAFMHRVLVDERRWIGEGRFLHALNYCMLLPGPEATQLATYIGWLLHRTAGGLAAGLLFLVPGAVVMLGLSVLYAGFQSVPLVEGLFYGLKPAVLAVVVEAVLRIGRRALTNPAMLTLAAAAFLAIFALGVPFPLIVLVAALVGFAGGRLRPASFVVVPREDSGAGAEAVVLGDRLPAHTQPSAARAVRLTAIWLTLWLAPVAALVLVLGPDDTFARIAVFFSKMAVVTFGGAYAVLAYVAQEAVTSYGWLAPGEMLDGLGLAETTPGPLILVTQFVGFMGAFRAPGGLAPFAAGVAGAVLTLWVTFVPCFLWIFVGAPYVEVLRGNRPLSAALGAITAAVVGVILNLAVWFALHVLFAESRPLDVPVLSLEVPVWASLDVGSLALGAAALVAMLHFRLGMIPTLAAGALLGVLWRLTLAT